MNELELLNYMKDMYNSCLSRLEDVKDSFNDKQYEKGVQMLSGMKLLIEYSEQLIKEAIEKEYEDYKKNNKDVLYN